jgi:hypothetical protein
LSERAKAGECSLLAHLGRKRCFSSSEPKSWIGSVPNSWIIQDQRRGRADLGDLLDRHPQDQGAGTAELLGEKKAEDVVLGEQLAHVPRVFTLAVDVPSARRDLACASCWGVYGEVAIANQRRTIWETRCWLICMTLAIATIGSPSRWAARIAASRSARSFSPFCASLASRLA